MPQKTYCAARARATVRLLLAAALVLLPGCAKSPSSTGSAAGPQLTISLTVRGRIRPDYFYFVLFNVAGDNNNSSGPTPVVAAPYGNGFASGAFTSFVRIDGTQPGGGGGSAASVGYGVYQVVPGSQLRTFSPLPSPVQTNTGNSTVQFRIPLSELATQSVPAGSIHTLQINFIATNTVPQDPSYTGTKEFDALGDSSQPGGINDFVSISTLQNGIYTNDRGLEPSGDVAEYVNGVPQVVDDPDLDIVNYSIQVSD